MSETTMWTTPICVCGHHAIAHSDHGVSTDEPCVRCDCRLFQLDPAASTPFTPPAASAPGEATEREEWVVPGVVITELGGNCPVQAEGTIDGHPFYFRARGETVSIEIGPGNTALVVDAMEQARRDPSACESEAVARETVEARGCWRYEEHNHEWPAAGWISEDFARAWIALAAVRYRESRTVIEGASEQ